MPRQRMIVPVFILTRDVPTVVFSVTRMRFPALKKKRIKSGWIALSRLTSTRDPWKSFHSSVKRLSMVAPSLRCPYNVRSFFCQRYRAGWIGDMFKACVYPPIRVRWIPELLGKYSVKTIELGVQSTDPEVLRQSGRGDTPESLERSVHLIRSRGYQLGLQLMLGLPGDSEEAFQQSVVDTLRFGPDFVRIYPALVVRGTALHEMYQRGEYEPWSLDRTVNALKIAVNRFEAAGIPVIRLGLHPEPSLLAHMVAGPHHPALRSLVDSRIGFDTLSDLLSRQGVLPERVTFNVPLRKLSNYTGHRKENILLLKERFAIKELVFTQTTDLTAPELVI